MSSKVEASRLYKQTPTSDIVNINLFVDFLDKMMAFVTLMLGRTLPNKEN